MYQDEEDCTDHEAQILRPKEMLRTKNYMLHRDIMCIFEDWGRMLGSNTHHYEALLW